MRAAGQLDVSSSRSFNSRPGHFSLDLWAKDINIVFISGLVFKIIKKSLYNKLIKYLAFLKHVFERESKSLSERERFFFKT